MLTFDDAYIEVSNNNGATWIESFMGMKSYYITRITGNDSMLVAGSYPMDNFDADVYFSIDQGRNWTTANIKMSDSYIHDLVISDNNMFAIVQSLDRADNKGILFSSNYGKTWNNFNEGLFTTYLNDLDIDNGEIIIGSYGAGLSRIDVPEILNSPTLILPANSASDLILHPKFDWSDVENIDSYNFQIANKYESFNKHIITQSSTTVSE